MDCSKSFGKNQISTGPSSRCGISGSLPCKTIHHHEVLPSPRRWRLPVFASSGRASRQHRTEASLSHTRSALHRCLHHGGWQAGLRRRERIHGVPVRYSARDPQAEELDAPEDDDVSRKTSPVEGALKLANNGASKALSLLSPEAEGSEAVVATSRWNRRWTIIGLCFVAFMLCNMDRVNMSIAILPMSQQYAWDSTTVGLVQSSFFWGYLVTQVLGGVWADKFGGKKVLGFGVIWWSVATAFTPIAAKLGLPALLLARACMGIGEGVAMPAMNNLLSRWVPVRERSRSLALVYSGMYTGSILGLGFSPHMIHYLAWPSVFYVFGSLGVVWYILWDAYAESSPLVDPRCGEAERAYICANTIQQAPAQKIPWGLLLSKAPVWALIVSHFCHNWGTFILLTWMPTYYNQVLGLDMIKSGILSVLPWVTMAISANIGGWIADTLVSKGWSVTLVRKIMQTIGFMGPAFFLTQLGNVHTATGAVLCMMASQGLDAFSQSGLYSNHQDIGPRYSGVLLGMSNTAGVLAGVLGTAATGMILKNGTWDEVWQVAVGLYIVGTVVWNVFSTGERIFD